MRWRLCVPGILVMVSACKDAPTAAPRAIHRALDPHAAGILKRIARNTIDPSGTVTNDGHHVVVSGPIACTAGEVAELKATVTQRTTGAVAEGRGRIACTGGDQTWELRLQQEGKESFQEGDATVVALARTFDKQEVTDAHQWLVSVTLIRNARR